MRAVRLKHSSRSRLFTSTIPKEKFLTQSARAGWFPLAGLSQSKTSSVVSLGIASEAATDRIWTVVVFAPWVSVTVIATLYVAGFLHAWACIIVGAFLGFFP